MEEKIVWILIGLFLIVPPLLVCGQMISNAVAASKAQQPTTIETPTTMEPPTTIETPTTMEHPITPEPPKGGLPGVFDYFLQGDFWGYSNTLVIVISITALIILTNLSVKKRKPK